MSLEKKLVSGHGEARRGRGEAGRGKAKQRGGGCVCERVQHDGVRVRMHAVGEPSRGQNTSLGLLPWSSMVDMASDATGSATTTTESNRSGARGNGCSPRSRRTR